MISFSEQYGLVEQRPIQLDEVDEALRSRIWNFFYANELNESEGRFSLRFGTNYGIVEQILDRVGVCFADPDSPGGDEKNRRALKVRLRNCEWNEVYDFIVYYLEFVDPDRREQIVEGLNRILEEQKSGYRIVHSPDDSFGKCPIVPITNIGELRELRESLNTEYSSVNVAMNAAMQHYSDRNNPDYSACIKDSIAALESLLSHITGKDYTLGKNLKETKKQGIDMHPAFCDAIDKLYAFASDTVRHGNKSVSKYTDEPMARFVLITSSAAINYLISELAIEKSGDDIDA